MRKILLPIIMLTILISLGCEEIPRERFFNDEPEDSTPEVVISGDVLRVPSEYPTIRFALTNAEEGDTILIADGNFSGNGFRDLIIQRKSVVIKSENGPQSTILTLNGFSTEFHYGFLISGPSTSNTVIDGITIRGGFNNLGTAFYLSSTSPTIKNCIIRNNTASVAGGAIRCKASSPTIVNCTIVANKSLTGAGIMLLSNSRPIIKRSIIAFSENGEAIRCNDAGSYPTITCSNIFDNEGGDWIDCLEGLLNPDDGNLSVDPLFCGVENSNVYLQSGSLCLPDNNNCGTLIGALSTCPIR